MPGGGQPDTTTSTTTQKLDPVLAREIGPFAAYARRVVNRPYERYRGNLVAGFSPDQFAAFDRARAGSGAQGLYGELAGRVREGSGQEQAADAFLGSFYGNQQNPFFERQLGIGRQRIGEQYQNAIAPQLSSRYALSGAFGGTAQAEAESLAQRELGRALGEYETGSRSAEAERRYAQGLQAAGLTEQTAARRAGQEFGLIGAQEAAYGRDLARLEAVGQAQQAQNQNLLNARFSRFQDRRGYPERQFNIYRDAIAALTGAAPRSQTTTQTALQGGPSTGANIAGGALTGAGLGLAGTALAPATFGTSLIPAAIGGILGAGGGAAK